MIFSRLDTQNTSNYTSKLKGCRKPGKNTKKRRTLLAVWRTLPTWRYIAESPRTISSAWELFSKWFALGWEHKHRGLLSTTNNTGKNTRLVKNFEVMKHTWVQYQLSRVAVISTKITTASLLHRDRKYAMTVEIRRRKTNRTSIATTKHFLLVDGNQNITKSPSA